MSAPGWYPDPYQRAQLRYHDGNVWTQSVSSGGTTWVEQPVPASAPRPPVVAAPARRGGGKLIIGLILGLLLGAGGAAFFWRSDGAEPVVDDETGAITIPSLQQALGRFDTYAFTLRLSTTGPTANDQSTTDVVVEHDEARDATYTATTTTASGADAAPTTTTTERWSIGGRVCNASGGEHVLERVPPAQNEVSDALTALIDLQLVAPQAQRVGAETVAGVEAVHYSFSVPGLGRASGAQVTANDGAFWLASDGGYLVKYQVSIDVRTAPEGDAAATVYSGELAAELTSTNQPVDITMPAACRG